MHQSLEKVEEDKDAGKSVFQSKQEKEVDPPDPKNVSLLKDSSCLASEAARTNLNHTPLYRTTPRNVCAFDNVAASHDNVVDSQPTPRRLRQALEAEAFWANDICVTCKTTVATATHNIGVTARCTEIVP